MMKSEGFFRLRISHACRGNYSVCVGVCTRTLVARTFSLRDVQTSRTRMAQGVCSVHVAYLHLAFSVLMFHAPSLFPHGHFDTTFPSAPSSSSFTRPKSAGQAHFRTSAEEFGYLADPTHSTLSSVNLKTRHTIPEEIITVLTRYRPIVLELI